MSGNGLYVSGHPCSGGGVKSSDRQDNGRCGSHKGNVAETRQLANSGRRDLKLQLNITVA